MNWESSIFLVLAVVKSPREKGETIFEDEHEMKFWSLSGDSIYRHHEAHR